jgi:hypothetical protein
MVMVKKIGPTKQYPHGKLNPEDRGELAVGVRVEKGMIVVDFGTDLSWVALTPESAIEFATVLLAKANAMLRQAN